MFAIRTAALAFLALALAAPAAAQTLRGRVVDARSGQGIAEATVSVLDRGRTVARARSGEDGAFEIEMRREATIRLRAERLGFQPSLSDTVTVRLRETVEVDLRLSTEALAIAPLTVTGRREPRRVRGLEFQGYYERESRGWGKFMRREDFANRGTRDMAHLLSREPTLQTHVDGRGKVVVYFNRSVPSPFERNGFARPSTRTSGGQIRPPRFTVEYCQPRFYVDGVPQYVTKEMTINELISPDHVEAVELYRGPSEVPERFAQGDTSCGVIAIWSRSEPPAEGEGSK